MLFSELVLQGVRNFHDMRRIALGGGLTVLVGGPGSGKSTIADVLLHILFPDPTEPGTGIFKAGEGAEACRAALTVDDRGGARYRLVMDLVGGAVALTQFDPSTSKFAPVSNSVNEIIQYFSSQIHLPHKDILQEIFISRANLLPSTRPVQAAPQVQQEPAPAGGGFHQRFKSGGGAVMGGAMSGATAAPKRKLPPSQHFPPEDGGGGGASFPGYQGMDPQEELLPDDPDEIRRQIESMKMDLEMVQGVDEAQFKLDGVQSKLFEIEQKLKKFREAEGQVQQTERRLEDFGNLSELPPDFEKRVRDYDQAQERLNRDLARLNEDKEKWERKAGEIMPIPLIRNRLFLLGLLVGFGALGIGALGFVWYEALRWVALLDLVGFGVVVVVAIRHIDQSMAAERGRTRLERIEERREKLTRQFELESTIVRKTMADIGVEKPGQIIEQYNQRAKVVAELEQAKARLEEQKNDPALAEAEARREELQSQADELEGQLAGAGGMMMDPREMERKIEQLTERLQQIESGEQAGPGAEAAQEMDPYGMDVGAPPGAALGEASAFTAEPAFPGMDGGVDHCRLLMKLSQDLFLMSREQLEQMLAARASQYLAALTGQAYSQLSFTESGEVEVLQASTQGKLPYTSLPPATQDLVYLGLKFTIIEAFSRKQPVPVLLDDPFARMAPNLHDMLGRMLAGLSRSTQVVLLTSQPAWSQHATTTIQL